jgi:hypothetical protein
VPSREEKSTRRVRFNYPFRRINGDNDLLTGLLLVCGGRTWVHMSRACDSANSTGVNYGKIQILVAALDPWVIPQTYLVGATLEKVCFDATVADAR